MGAGAAATTYIEDVFSTYLYTGNGTTQTINNGINLSGKGGMVWIKGRSGATDHALYDTVRGAYYDLTSTSTAAQTTQSTGLTAFNSNGFSIGTLSKLNTSAATYVSWTFRKSARFFDVVTYTGDGSSSRQLAHALGVTPGMIVAKKTGNTSDWFVYHKGYSYLDNTSGGAIFTIMPLNKSADNNSFYGNTSYYASLPNSSTFTVGSSNNASGATYVAYVFAHDAASNGAIQCGSYVGNGSYTGPSITLGWEPQFLLIRNASGTGNWQILDTARGMSSGDLEKPLQANLTDGEPTVEFAAPWPTGFQVFTSSSQVNTSGSTYIYVAIRKGPMRV